MNTDKMIVRVESFDLVTDQFGNTDLQPDGDVCECTVDEFCRENESMPDEDRADVAHLAVGEKLQFGGGAAPVFTVTRIA